MAYKPGTVLFHYTTQAGQRVAVIRWPDGKQSTINGTIHTLPAVGSRVSQDEVRRLV